MSKGEECSECSAIIYTDKTMCELCIQDELARHEDDEE